MLDICHRAIANSTPYEFCPSNSWCDRARGEVLVDRRQGGEEKSNIYISVNIPSVCFLLYFVYCLLCSMRLAVADARRFWGFWGDRCRLSLLFSVLRHWCQFTTFASHINDAKEAIHLRLQARSRTSQPPSQSKYAPRHILESQTKTQIGVRLPSLSWNGFIARLACALVENAYDHLAFFKCRLRRISNCIHPDMNWNKSQNIGWAPRQIVDCGWMQHWRKTHFVCHGIA